MDFWKHLCYNSYVFFGLSMGKTILRIFGAIALTAVLTGCVIVINNGKPTDAEKTLMDIQTSASQEVAQINAKIQAGNYSVPQIQELVQQAKKVVDENLKKINDLKLPERTKALADKTKEYLQKAGETYQSFLQMSSQTVNQTGEQVRQLVKNLQTMSEPLLNMAKQLEDMKNQFLLQLQQATSPTQTQQK